MSKENKSIQDKIAELSTLVEWFDSDDFVLETAIDTFKQAESLAEAIEGELKALKNDIQIIKQKFDNASQE